MMMAMPTILGFVIFPGWAPELGIGGGQKPYTQFGRQWIRRTGPTKDFSLTKRHWNPALGPALNAPPRSGRTYGTTVLTVASHQILLREDARLVLLLPDAGRAFS
mmetsp:Transcript_20920/g.23487  ORF Transcript_20920/g.23487 Transcript_20920/m.23487 type:complete len:105 (+) Transcript_20920:814-1128(+)